MHAYGFDFSEFLKLFQVAAEFVVGLIHITLARIHGFIMVADFMAQFCYFFNDTLIKALRNNTKIVGAFDAQPGLDAGEAEGVLGEGVDVVAEDY